MSLAQNVSGPGPWSSGEELYSSFTLEDSTNNAPRTLPAPPTSVNGQNRPSANPASPRPAASNQLRAMREDFVRRAKQKQAEAKAFNSAGERPAHFGGGFETKRPQQPNVAPAGVFQRLHPGVENLSDLSNLSKLSLKTQDSGESDSKPTVLRALMNVNRGDRQAFQRTLEELNQGWSKLRKVVKGSRFTTFLAMQKAGRRQALNEVRKRELVRGAVNARMPVEKLIQGGQLNTAWAEENEELPRELQNLERFPMFQESAAESREHLREDPDVKDALLRWWVRIVDPRASLVSKRNYITLCALLLQILFPDKYRRKQAAADAIAEWNHEMYGQSAECGLDFAHFSGGLLELADLHLSCLTSAVANPSAYVAFLDSLLEKLGQECTRLSVPKFGQAGDLAQYQGRQFQMQAKGTHSGVAPLLTKHTTQVWLTKLAAAEEASVLEEVAAHHRPETAPFATVADSKHRQLLHDHHRTKGDITDRRVQRPPENAVKSGWDAATLRVKARRFGREVKVKAVVPREVMPKWRAADSEILLRETERLKVLRSEVASEHTDQAHRKLSVAGPSPPGKFDPSTSMQRTATCKIDNELSISFKGSPEPQEVSQMFGNRDVDVSPAALSPWVSQLAQPEIAEYYSANSQAKPDTASDGGRAQSRDSARAPASSQSPRTAKLAAAAAAQPRACIENKNIAQLNSAIVGKHFQNVFCSVPEMDPNELDAHYPHRMEQKLERQREAEDLEVGRACGAQTERGSADTSYTYLPSWEDTRVSPFLSLLFPVTDFQNDAYTVSHRDDTIDLNSPLGTSLPLRIVGEIRPTTSPSTPLANNKNPYNFSMSPSFYAGLGHGRRVVQYSDADRTAKVIPARSPSSTTTIYGGGFLPPRLDILDSLIQKPIHVPVPQQPKSTRKKQRSQPSWSNINKTRGTPNLNCQPMATEPDEEADSMLKPWSIEMRGSPQLPT
ncbi:hypothetical protein CYMTET_27193 [Cymbomonas tetramitiformis]|uniref:Uncharacterized protein n=1 Tax=Cymbomonas tetramitiformis TaxID=36881 RepID=A0AAE0FQW1_9CHLO|nr:hypothetical protein CYMTET_27193 [Cymbomonas tetramitiformis]